MKYTSKTRKAAVLLFSVAMLMAGGTPAVRGQSALDGFDPNANGAINAIVLQPDGKILIGLQADGKILVGGDFSGANSIGGQPRNRVARLEPITGSADSFDPNANDVSQTKGRIGQAVTSANFRSNVNVNGAINAGDASQVKANSGHAVP